MSCDVRELSLSVCLPNRQSALENLLLFQRRFALGVVLVNADPVQMDLNRGTSETVVGLLCLWTTAAGRFVGIGSSLCMFLFA